ncbi:MAG TPA: UPF0175 family protein [Blastocatellia bacterium]|nr:UPF0175 family protein [Blastocatellia bacterium]HMV86719.1 UPF0175 family protein [Blastocatellia bacterium]HMX25123.1 UPF0175 family protein [Blastocatellia bacterium]HNG33231.1 UPF0175 family protein [Blastocatellia bacterium]
MEITFNAFIPDDVAANIQNGSSTPLPRRLLELAAIQAHEAGLISSRQVQEMLGFADREELFTFFKANDVRDRSFTLEELERERAVMAALLNKSR